MAKAKDVRDKVVPITLSDGVERTLKFTLNALAELEDAYGSVDEAFKKLESNSIKAVRKILWAGLLHEGDPPLTETEVGNLIDIVYMQELMGTMNEALAQNMPTQEAAGPKLLEANEAEQTEERTDIDPNS